MFYTICLFQGLENSSVRRKKNAHCKLFWTHFRLGLIYIFVQWNILAVNEMILFWKLDLIERIKENFKTKTEPGCGKTESTLQPVGELSVKKWRNLRNESGQNIFQLELLIEIEDILISF